MVNSPVVNRPERWLVFFKEVSRNQKRITVFLNSHGGVIWRQLFQLLILLLFVALQLIKMSDLRKDRMIKQKLTIVIVVVVVVVVAAATTTTTTSAVFC